MNTAHRICLPLVLLVAGCTTAVTPEKAASVNPEKTGLVLATWFRNGPAQDSRIIFVQAPLESLSGNGKLGTSLDIKSTNELSLVEVPPGKYRIKQWYVYGGLDYHNDPAESFEFEVRAGEITYVGNFDLIVVKSRTETNWAKLDMWLVADDRSEKASIEFQKVYPELSKLPIRNVAPNKRFVWNEAPVTTFATSPPGR